MLVKRKNIKRIGILTLVSLFFVLIIPVKLAFSQDVSGDVVGQINSGEIGGSDQDIINSANSFGGTNITVEDKQGQALIKQVKSQLKTEGKKQNFLQKLFSVTLPKAGSKAFQSTLTTALNNIAFNAANYLAAGMTGQRPAFETRDFGDVLSDSLDSAAGDFLHTLGEEGFGGLNLCEPDFNIGIRIGLGLVDLSGAVKKSECTFSEMKNNWGEALQSDNFLQNFQTYFDPTSNDLGIALTTQSKYLEYVADQANKATEDLKLNEGWLNVRNLAGEKTTDRKIIEATLIRDLTSTNDNLAKFTGDAFVDALNIFLNQLLIQLVRNLLYGGVYQGGSGSTGSSGLYNFAGDPSTGSGAEAAKERFRQIKQPRFNVRGDYSILADLTICPNPEKAGPTNCVITDKFRDAIQNRKTVGQAIREGSLNRNGVFGFVSKDVEPRYVDENYPLRSMIILRTYRILPVGWEIAAQAINQKFSSDNSKSYTLGDMLECYESGQQGYAPAFQENEWCKGLVSPDWVLKAPLNYCAREGYGPELLGDPDVSNGQYSINRQDNYCADQQSCIKENFDGSCEVYGYCTEERPAWNFSASSCEPTYNTCQTFFGDGRESISYLKNTLDYCDESGVGCQWYCQESKLNYNNTIQRAELEWICRDNNNNNLDTSKEHIYFNRNAQECSAENEGCDEYIRTKAGLGVNLIPNSSFEDGSSISVDYWDGTGVTIDFDSLYGTRAIKLTDTAEGTFEYKNSILAESRYIISGHVKVLDNYSDNGGISIKVGDDHETDIIANTNGEWWQVSELIIFDQDYNNGITIKINSAGTGNALFDAIQLEEVLPGTTEPSDYKDYREAGLAYQKMIPDYAKNFCCCNNRNINYFSRSIFVNFL